MTNVSIIGAACRRAARRAEAGGAFVALCCAESLTRHIARLFWAGRIGACDARTGLRVARVIRRSAIRLALHAHIEGRDDHGD
ncbi:hypothetical protein O3U67_03010 [Brevundimonas diminuta]|uniref:hypothetical protein n=1 Tax=Brevundimonas diminuta TaxID=293 RepID=UPI0022AE628F|nr:hypothetical protein [Brevundimonas diminuta]MCZ4107044.1 hypothetical protein [Brevundimonas diminuta]